MNTADLFKEVCKLLELSDSEYQERIGDFFESLTTSKEFILLNDGNWDLRINHSVKIDIDDIYEEIDSEEDENEDDYDYENMSEFLKLSVAQQNKISRKVQKKASKIYLKYRIRNFFK